MKYYECSFTYNFRSPAGNELTEIVNDILAAELGEAGFESFIETSDGLNAYIPEHLLNVEKMWDRLRAFPLEGVDIRFEGRAVEDRNWNEEWEKNYFQPVEVGDECIIHASFHTVKSGYKYDIVIDPKMSFGTGNHETTSLMIEELLKIDPSNRTLLDMGCGTGVLAILASMRGASRTVAVDVDEWAYNNAKENAAINKAGVEIYLGDAGLIPSLGTFDFVLANINRNILLSDIRHYAAALKPNGLFFASGFYVEEAGMIAEECEKNGISPLSTSEKNRWACLKGIRREY